MLFLQSVWRLHISLGKTHCFQKVRQSTRCAPHLPAEVTGLPITAMAIKTITGSIRRKVIPTQEYSRLGCPRNRLPLFLHVVLRSVLFTPWYDFAFESVSFPQTVMHTSKYVMSICTIERSYICLYNSSVQVGESIDRLSTRREVSWLLGLACHLVPFESYCYFGHTSV